MLYERIYDKLLGLTCEAKKMYMKKALAREELGHLGGLNPESVSTIRVFSLLLEDKVYVESAAHGRRTTVRTY